MDCSLSRLSSLVENEEVEFDADIAGIGVLIAFLATSLVAFVTLLAAYITLSVPLRLCNAGDTVLSTQLRRKLPKLKRVKVVESQSERIAAFMAFMLSISDQILVSQVAILIAAFIIHMEITIYSVNIVIALGCLASTVHLGSFPFYIDRLRDHGTAKMVRVIAMAAGSGMLVFVLIIQLSNTWDMETRVYFTCVLHDFQIRGDDIANRVIGLFVPISVLYGTYEIVQLLYMKEPPRSITDPSSVAQLSEQPNHAALRRLEEQPIEEVGEDLSSIKREAELLERLLRLIDQKERDSITNLTDTPDIPLQGIAQESDSCEMQPDMAQYTYAQLKTSFLKPNLSRMSFKDIWRQTRESDRHPLLSKWLQLQALSLLVSESKSNFRLKARVCWVAEQWAFHQCRGSYMWRLLWLWSGNVYGIAAVFIARSERTGLSGDPDHWGFGQVVPLALLALPFFTAMESHADYKRNMKAITAKSHASPSGPELVPGVSVEINNPTGLSKDDREATNYVRKVDEALQKRAENMRQPELYKWVKGQELKHCSSIWSAVSSHTIFMVFFTTAMGLCMALGDLWAMITLISILLILTVRRAAGLIWMAKCTRTGPAVLKYLGTIRSNELQQGGNHGERMMEAQAAGAVEGNA